MNQILNTSVHGFKKSVHGFKIKERHCRNNSLYCFRNHRFSSTLKTVPLKFNINTQTPFFRRRMEVTLFKCLHAYMSMNNYGPITYSRGGGGVHRPQSYHNFRFLMTEFLLTRLLTRRLLLTRNYLQTTMLEAPPDLLVTSHFKNSTIKN